MTFIAFLIIVGFTNSVHSLIFNSTTNGIQPMCNNISSLRNKRSHTEYTRWRPNQLTTQEFIVKVLDDDITSPKPEPVVAVNILPATKGTEKIIVGGVIVPSPTTAFTVEQQSEYTRFVPPTLMSVSRGHKDLLLAQAAVTSGSKIPPYPSKVINKNEPAYPQYKFGLAPQRDESPPASPQFVARTPTLLARQYAPITPVVFTQRTSVSHLTPPAIERYTFPGMRLKPTRTSPLPDVLVPSRTTLSENELINFHNFEDEEIKLNEIVVSRSTFLPLSGPERTLGINNIFHAREKTTESVKLFEYTSELRKIFVEQKKTKLDEEREFDSPYGMMFYEEDNESTKKGHSNYKDDSEEDITLARENNISMIETNENTFENITELQEFESNTEIDSEFENNTLATINQLSGTPISIIEPSKMLQETQHNCSLLRLRQLNFNSPRTLAEIVAKLKHWAENSPVAKWVDITAGNYTVMENPIYMMIVDDPSSGQIVSAKHTVMVVAGIQGRDHHAVTAALYVLYQLIERTEKHSDLLTKYRFWIIPVFNPDGYEYSMTFPQRREWTKNLWQNWDSSAGRDSCAIFGLRCSIRPCYGVNLDRNFEYQWIPTEELRAEHPCGELFAGTRQLSEAETLALTRFLHSQRVPLHTFIAFKEGDVLGIMYPYSHTKKTRTFDHVYRQRASRAASAAYSISGRPYVAGQTSQFLPLYAGGIEDWVDGHLGIDNTYTVMMFRPTDSYNSKYVTEQVVHEAYAAMDTLLLYSAEPTMLGPSVVTLSKSNGNLQALAFPIISVLCSSMLLITDAYRIIRM